MSKDKKPTGKVLDVDHFYAQFHNVDHHDHGDQHETKEWHEIHKDIPPTGKPFNMKDCLCQSCGKGSDCSCTKC